MLAKHDDDDDDPFLALGDEKHHAVVDEQTPSLPSVTLEVTKQVTNMGGQGLSCCVSPRNCTRPRLVFAPV